VRREGVDRDVADLGIHELPAARGCTYVVPAEDFALALRLGQPFGPEPEMKEARKLGVADREIDRLCSAVLDSLKAEPLSPEDLRSRVGDAVRSLGEAGKKRGLSTTLPLALGRLQAEGEIRRIPNQGRLDQQRYRYTPWQPNPLAGFKLSLEECHVELARRFFRWIGPATFSEFQGFAGLGAKATKAALEPLGLEDIGDGRLLLSEDQEAWDSFQAPQRAEYSLVGNLDSHVLARRNIASLLADEDRNRLVSGDKAIVKIDSVHELLHHVILDRGRIIGLWEFDPDAQEIVWFAFERVSSDLREQIEATQEFVRQDLGDVRAFSLDSPKSRAPRLERLRAAAA
jgi:hypothetical protein